MLKLAIEVAAAQPDESEDNSNLQVRTGPSSIANSPFSTAKLYTISPKNLPFLCYYIMRVLRVSHN